MQFHSKDKESDGKLADYTHDEGKDNNDGVNENVNNNNNDVDDNDVDNNDGNDDDDDDAECSFDSRDIESAVQAGAAAYTGVSAAFTLHHLHHHHDDDHDDHHNNDHDEDDDVD